MANNGEVYIVEEEEEPENFITKKPQSTIGRKSTVLLFNNKMTFDKPSETVEPPAGQVMEQPMKTPAGGESYEDIQNAYMAMILSVKPDQFTELLEFVLTGQNAYAKQLFLGVGKFITGSQERSANWNIYDLATIKAD